jgi:hypothetical protein
MYWEANFYCNIANMPMTSSTISLGIVVGVQVGNLTGAIDSHSLSLLP